MKKKKSEKGINNQRNNLYYIKGNKYIHVHTYTKVHTDTRRLTLRTFSTVTHILEQVERIIKTVL